MRNRSKDNLSGPRRFIQEQAGEVNLRNLEDISNQDIDTQPIDNADKIDDTSNGSLHGGGR